MIVYPSLPSGHTIFCDDIRHETTGKVTYVGSYGTHMFVQSVPAIIPKICCAVTFREAMDSFGKVTIRAIQEIGDEETVLAQLEYEINPGDVPETPSDEPFMMREGRFFFEMSPFAIGGPGKLKVRAFRDDIEIRLGALIIEVKPEATDETPAD